MTFSARSKEILFRVDPKTSHDAVRLFMADGQFLDVRCQVGNGLLLDVIYLPPAIKDDFIARLTADVVHRGRISADEVKELSFRLDRRLQIGGRPLVHAILRGSFLRVLYAPTEVIDAHRTFVNHTVKV